MPYFPPSDDYLKISSEYFMGASLGVSNGAGSNHHCLQVFLGFVGSSLRL
ncbi:MAG: hypothetical protein V7K20_24145 [Nostoc sp.]